MNVNFELPEELFREARHRAADESKSLPAWVAEVVKRELDSPNPVAVSDQTSDFSDSEPSPKRGKTLLEALTLPGAPEWFFEKELPLEDRKSMTVREFTFEDG